MDRLEAQLQRTWVQLLVDSGYSEYASIAVETDVFVGYGYEEYDNYRQPISIYFDVPTSAFVYVNQDELCKKVFERAMRTVSLGRIEYDGTLYEELPFVYRVRVVEIEEGWKNMIKSLIAEFQVLNQGVVTQMASKKGSRQVHTYNEMTFGSKSEIRIAQELEAKKVLFFPLPLAVRADTGNFYKDHREADFLICQNGKWGILEVSYHPGRYEKDSEKDIWFKQSGILCTQHYTAERCWNEPERVVSEFLAILSKY